MKISKIIKRIIGICVVSGITVTAYKVGENDGRRKERHHNASDNIDYYDDDMEYDEEDDGCIAPRRAVYEVQRE